MTKQLTVHNATVTTAAVEVKTLTISGKQVTLAVFRQLREEQLIAEDGTLNGTPWGYVNYHPDKCDDAGHRHFVWQRGDELLRSRVESKVTFEKTFWGPEADRALISEIREWVNGRADGDPLESEILAYRIGKEFLDGRSLGEMFGMKVVARVTDEMNAYAGSRRNAEGARKYLQEIEETGLYFGAPVRPGQVEQQRASVLHYDEELVRLCAEMDRVVAMHGGEHGRVREALTAAVKAESMRRERHRTVRAELGELPQLFIAV